MSDRLVQSSNYTLQCAIPVFDELLPSPHNEIVLNLLFELATWHALAKLRMHTDSSVNFLETSTKRLGKAIRGFASTSQAFHTIELPSEETARRKKQVKLDLKGKGNADVGTAHKKLLNLSTYKLHALGDYASTIRRYGTTDNYSTQTVITRSHLNSGI